MTTPTSPTDQKPTMPEMTALQGRIRAVNIVEGIGAEWDKVGTALLDDKDGTIIPAIAREHGNNAECINTEILRRWIQGKGIPDRTWKGLLCVLRSVRRNTLADDVEEVLTEEEATDPPHLDPPDNPPPPGVLQRFVQFLRNLCHRQSRLPQGYWPHPPTVQDDPVTPSCTDVSGIGRSSLIPHSHLTTDDLSLPATAQQELSPPPATQQQQPSSLPPTDQPQPPPPSPPHCPPLQPRTPIWYFQQYLVKFYSHIKDPEATWPPSPSNIFINLAIINREKVSTKELHQFMLATLNKGVDTILETNAPVEIEQLVDTKPGEKQHCVLVEGAPGVGKTTLSWEICKRWSEGNLFKQYSLILLLRLRDESVQSAQTLKDLVLYPYHERLEAITQHLKDTDGTNTLILLEGLDELPQHLLTQPSIFTRLLAGKDLPGATILVTSRPSATAQLWKKWKERITRHIKILGFTEDNITAYVASILHPRQLPDFDTYLCTAPSIKQLMYIPLHSGIVVELYRMYRDSDKTLPTDKMALYKALVNTILTRYLAKHPTHKDEEIDIENFTDLPDDVYPAFVNLTELAYKSVSQQQLIFKDVDIPIQHLGLMDAVAELFPNKRKTNYSYSFLHLSIQEYLGAVHVSLMDVSTQEKLLDSMSTEEHLQNMAMFLAAITKFKGMNWELVKQAIQRECEEEDGELTLSRYSLQIVYETENVRLLEGHSLYRYSLSDYSPSSDFTALGYSIATSNYKWELVLGNYVEHMRSTSQVDLLVQALCHHSNSSYSIVKIECYHKETEFTQHLLAGLPEHALQQLEALWLASESHQPLPMCLPGLISSMNRLRSLLLWRATEASLTVMLHALAQAPTCTLERLDLTYSQFSPPAMHALCAALLGHSKSLTVLWLRGCGLTDGLACILATALHGLPGLEVVGLSYNTIGDEGAVAIAGALHGLPGLKEVNLQHNTFGGRGHAALNECKKTNKGLGLYY